MRLFLGLLMPVVFALSAQSATNVNQDEAMQELATIKRIFATAYAPAAWKKQHLGWDLDTEYQKALSAVANKSDFTSLDYRRIANDFLGSTKDYHVGIGFHSTEKAVLPFSVAGTAGRYFLVQVDRTKLSEEHFPSVVGDEILEFGGRPVADVVAEIKARIDTGTSPTDEGVAQYLLTRRSAQGGFAVPQGPIEVKFKHIDESTQQETITSRQLIWDYTPEDIFWSTQSLAGSEAKTKSPLRKQMVWGGLRQMKMFASEDVKAPKPDPNPFGFGERVSWVPALGAKIWESAATDKFHAYIYRTPEGKVIGYVRLPSYDAGTAEFVEFKALIKRFQATTDGLVIDEVNNPGGSVMYVYALMSVLYSTTSFAPPHQMSIYPQEVKEAADMVNALKNVKNDKDAQKALADGQDNWDGYPINYQFAQFALNFGRFVVQQAKEGKKLSDLSYLWGVDRINPDKEVNYTKPILVLVNATCFSGGDFFPAMLQDNQRAKIFGSRTAGAGGYVLEVALPSRLGLESFSYTGSIAQRIGKTPIENLGVTPDIPYELTPEDFINGFTGYKDAVNDAISNMVDAVPAPVKAPAKP